MFGPLRTVVEVTITSIFRYPQICTSVPVNEALQVIRNKFHNDDTLAQLSVLQVEVIMEMLEVCLRTTYFQVNVQICASYRKIAWLW
jgi:hypothetical protein